MSIQLDEYTGKKVILVHHQNTADAVEVEGTVQAASAAGLLIKPKGKTNIEIIDAASIDDIRLAPEPVTSPKAVRGLKAKQIKLVQLGQARAHLLERHGLPLAYVNGLSEDEAFQVHQELDHVALDLGHVHIEASLTESELAIRQAEKAANAAPVDGA